MFGRMSRKEMEFRIRELEAACAGLEIKEREPQVLRDDYVKKIQAANENQRLFEAEKKAFEDQCKEKQKALAQTLAAEEQAEKKELKRSIDAERAHAAQLLNDRINSMQECYVFFLSQMKLMMDMVTKAACNTTDLFFIDEKVDVFQRFCKEMEGGLEKFPLTEKDFYQYASKGMVQPEPLSKPFILNETESAEQKEKPDITIGG